MQAGATEMIRAVEARASEARLKELEPFLLDKAGESLNYPTHKTHLSFTVFRPWLPPKGPTGSHPKSPGWSRSHSAPSFLLRASHNHDLTSLGLPSSVGPAPDEARHGSCTTCLSSGWEPSSVSLMTLQTVFQPQVSFLVPLQECSHLALYGVKLVDDS